MSNLAKEQKKTFLDFYNLTELTESHFFAVAMVILKSSHKVALQGDNNKIVKNE